MVGTQNELLAAHIQYLLRSLTQKPPEVQEKKAHIRYLCAENEFIKWGWYSMLRLTLGPPQQLVDNYNAQLGVSKEHS